MEVVYTGISSYRRVPAGLSLATIATDVVIVYDIMVFIIINRARLLGGTVGEWKKCDRGVPLDFILFYVSRQSFFQLRYRGGFYQSAISMLESPNVISALKVNQRTRTSI